MNNFKSINRLIIFTSTEFPSIYYCIQGTVKNDGQQHDRTESITEQSEF